jgi:hypothetical protein
MTGHCLPLKSPTASQGSWPCIRLARVRAIRCRIELNKIKAAPAAPLARRQRRAQPWEARPRTPGHAPRSSADQNHAHVAQARTAPSPSSSAPVVPLAGCCVKGGPRWPLTRDRHLQGRRARIGKRGQPGRVTPLKILPAAWCKTEPGARSQINGSGRCIKNSNR